MEFCEVAEGHMSHCYQGVIWSFGCDVLRRKNDAESEKCAILIGIFGYSRETDSALSAAFSCVRGYGLGIVCKIEATM